MWGNAHACGRRWKGWKERKERDPALPPTNVLTGNVEVRPYFEFDSENRFDPGEGYSVFCRRLGRGGRRRQPLANCAAAVRTEEVTRRGERRFGPKFRMGRMANRGRR